MALSISDAEQSLKIILCDWHADLCNERWDNSRFLQPTGVKQTALSAPDQKPVMEKEHLDRACMWIICGIIVTQIYYDAFPYVLFSPIKIN